MSNLIVKYSRAYLLHIYKAYGNTIINNTKQQQQLDLWCWTPYFVWPSEILMKYPFLVGDLSSFILSTCTMYLSFFFLQRRHEWHQSHPYDKCQSLWRITLIYSVLLNTTDVNIAFQWKLSFLKFPRIFTYKWQFSYFSVLFVPLQYCILSLEKKKTKKKTEKNSYALLLPHGGIWCVCALDHFRDTLGVWSIYLLTAAPLSVPLLTCKFTWM